MCQLKSQHDREEQIIQRSRTRHLFLRNTYVQQVLVNQLKEANDAVMLLLEFFLLHFFFPLTRPRSLFDMKERTYFFKDQIVYYDGELREEPW